MTINYTVTNSNIATANAPGFSVDFWGNRTTVPGVGDASDASVEHAAGLAIGEQVSGVATIPIPDGVQTGTAYAIVDFANDIAERNDGNNTTSGSWITLLPDLNVSLDYVVSDGVNVHLNYTVTNIGTAASGIFDIGFWGNLGAIPTKDDVSAITPVAHAALEVDEAYTGSVSVPDTAVSGTAYVRVDHNEDLLELDETNNVSGGVAWTSNTNVVNAPLVYDFSDGLIPTGFVMTGIVTQNTPPFPEWAIDATAAAGCATNCLRSWSSLLDSETSCVTVTATNTSGITFDYAVSSENTYDWLEFYVDAGIQSRWSGTPTDPASWVVNNSYTPASGAHEYKWCYVKDGSGLDGQDAVWIDNILIQ